MTENAFKKRLETGPPILADGAMGTQLYERIGYRYVCFEELNVSNPRVVQAVHRAYLDAGAELILTNTFTGNRYLLGMRGLESHVEEFARAGARIAREAQESMGAQAFVGGSIGPLNRTLGVPRHEMVSAFQEVVEGLLLGGVDVFVLETFGSLEELLIALEVCRENSSLPVIASVTFSADGRTLAGELPEDVSKSLFEAGAEVVGANCGFGPQPTFEVIEAMRTSSAAHLSAMPNAGLPARQDGRLVYASTPEYFADYALRLDAAGVRVIGGCCGTTPAHIAQMKIALDAGVELLPIPDAVRTPLRIDSFDPDLIGRAEAPTTILAESLANGRFVISVEMRPSRGSNPAKVLHAADMLRGAGVDAVDVTDSALGRVRMNPFATAHLIQERTGLDVITHLTTRDRNLMALQADLIGAHALGVRHVLALTGDPPNPNSWAPTTGVYDLDSVGLIALIKQLNNGLDAAGTSIGLGTSFLIGCSFNPTADDIEREIERLGQKIEAGADFIMTQAVYDAELFHNIMSRIGTLRIPLILELLPLQSFKNAEFIHNELPGVKLPAEVLERMKLARSEGEAVGAEIAMELFRELAPIIQGVYIVPSFDRYEQAATLTRRFREVVSPTRTEQLR